MNRTFKDCRFRACLGTAAAGWGCLAALTSILPDVICVGLLMLLLMMAFPVALLIDCALDGINDLAAFRQFSLRQLFVFLTWLAFYLSLLIEPWTFYLAFSLSRSELERLAKRVEAGDEIAPQWAGLFFVEKAGHTHGDGKAFTVLWTNTAAGFAHPGSAHFPHNDYSIGLRHNPEWSFFIQD